MPSVQGSVGGLGGWGPRQGAGVRVAVRPVQVALGGCHSGQSRVGCAHRGAVGGGRSTENVPEPSHRWEVGGGVVCGGA